MTFPKAVRPWLFALALLFVLAAAGCGAQSPSDEVTGELPPGRFGSSTWGDARWQ